MDGLVTLRPVIEDDLSWLSGLRDGPAATGPHEWHGWSDPRRERRQWAESGLLGDHGGTLVIQHRADRVGSISWRKVQTGPTAFNWAIGSTFRQGRWYDQVLYSVLRDDVGLADPSAEEDGTV